VTGCESLRQRAPRRRQVRDFRNDVILAEACRTDVELHCPNVPAGAPRRARARRSHTCVCGDGRAARKAR